MKKILLAMVLAMAFLTTPAQAARPNHTLVVTPAAPVVGDTIALTACGYKAGTVVGIATSTPAPVFTFYSGGPADSDGCVTGTYHATEAGTHSASAFRIRLSNPEVTVSFEVAP